MHIDLMLIVAAVVLLILDMRQTLDIKNHPGIHEINPLLGKHPTDTRIYTYFATCITAFLAITHFMPPEYQAFWGGGIAAVELFFFVIPNHQLGLKI